MDLLKKYIQSTEKPITLGSFTLEIPESTKQTINAIKSLGGVDLGTTTAIPGYKQTEEAKKARILQGFKEQQGQGVGKAIVGAVKFGGSILQETAKSGGAVGLTLATPFVGTQEITSEQFKDSPALLKIKEFIFGKDPVKSIQTRIAEAEVKLPRGEALPFGIKAPSYLATIGVIGTIGLDFTTGGGKDDVIKLLAKTDKIGDVVNILKKIGVADDLIPAYSKVIAKTSRLDDITKALDKIVDIQKTTKAARGIKEVVEELPIPKIKKGFEWKPRQFLQSVKEARPDIPIKVGGQYVPRSTDRLAIKAKNLVLDNIDEAERIARTRTDDTAIATASELIKHYGDEAAKASDNAVKNALYEKASSIAHLTARNLTEQGRSVQAASIMGRLTPEGMLRFAAREINKYNELVDASPRLLRKKISQLTKEQTGMILSEYKKIEKMPDGIQKAMAFKKLSDAISDLIPSSMYKKIIAVWKAGLLTGIKTSGLNIFSNLFHGVSEVIKDIPAVAVDSVASLFTGKRTLALTVKGTKGGIIEGFQKGWRYLTTGFDERNIGAKLDYTKVSFGKGKVGKALQKYEESIFHLMGTEDQPFYYGAKARSLYSQAIAQSKNAKLKGDDAIKFVDDLIKSPTDEMLKFAVADAETAVFQNQTTLGKIAKTIQKAPGGEVIVPFGRTPAAVATQFINYTPVGIVKTIAEQIKRGQFDQRLFAQGMGRGITGTVIMYLGTELFKNDLISLSYPKGEREQQLWRAEGRTANSIKIGGKWRTIAVLGPAGNVLIAGATFQQALEETGSPTQALIASTFGGIKSLKEQTFLSGVNQIMDAIDNPESYGTTYGSSLISSIAPTLVGDIAKATDIKERRTEGFWDKVKAKIPGLRQTLEPQIDILGQERERGGNWLETMIDPSRPSNIIDSAVAEELRRLFDAGYKVSPTLLGDKKGYKNLTSEENTALWKRVGEKINSKLNSLFNLGQYKNNDDEDKGAMVEDVVKRATLDSRVEAVMDLTEGLSGKELETKLTELKEGGLMTKEVFKKFLQLQ